MKNEKKIKPSPRLSAGRLVSVKIQPDMIAALKAIGNGKTATAINNILDTYREEIMKAAEDAKKAS